MPIPNDSDSPHDANPTNGHVANSGLGKGLAIILNRT